MAVMARESWTDERLDDFRENMNDRFDLVDKRFDQVDKRFDRVEADIRELRGDVKELQRMLLGMSGVMVTGFLALAGLIVF
jgi:hypothetical protein